jgi:hypothetical protein
MSRLSLLLPALIIYSMTPDIWIILRYDDFSNHVYNIMNNSKKYEEDTSSNISTAFVEKDY